MATTSDLRVGIVIKFNNELHTILAVEHRTPGNLRAFYQVKMRNIRNNKQIENRFRSGEEIQIERLEPRNFQFLYKSNDEYYFMDNGTYEQIHIMADFIGKQGEYLKEGQIISILFHESSPLVIEMPPHVILKVTSAPPGVKGNTATGATKPVTVETGTVINAPLFIDEGDTIKVDTRTGEYIERVKV